MTDQTTRIEPEESWDDYWPRRFEELWRRQIVVEEHLSICLWIITACLVLLASVGVACGLAYLL